MPVSLNWLSLHANKCLRINGENIKFRIKLSTEITQKISQVKTNDSLHTSTTCTSQYLKPQNSVSLNYILFRMTLEWHSKTMAKLLTKSVYTDCESLKYLKHHKYHFSNTLSKKCSLLSLFFFYLKRKWYSAVVLLILFFSIPL